MIPDVEVLGKRVESKYISRSIVVQELCQVLDITNFSSHLHQRSSLSFCTEMVKDVTYH